MKDVYVLATIETEPASEQVLAEAFSGDEVELTVLGWCAACGAGQHAETETHATATER
jgi:hypothetical protein